MSSVKDLAKRWFYPTGINIGNSEGKFFRNASNDWVEEAAIAGYIAGFEKAKQLILDDFEEYEQGDLYIEMPYSFFKNLGEEEADD